MDESQAALVTRNPLASAGEARDTGSIPGSGRSPGGGNGNPLQYSCLENSMERGAWRATAHGVTTEHTHRHIVMDPPNRKKRGHLVFISSLWLFPNAGPLSSKASRAQAGCFRAQTLSSPGNVSTKEKYLLCCCREPFCLSGNNAEGK